MPHRGHLVVHYRQLCLGHNLPNTRRVWSESLLNSVEPHPSPTELDRNLGVLYRDQPEPHHARTESRLNPAELRQNSTELDTIPWVFQLDLFGLHHARAESRLNSAKLHKNSTGLDPYPGVMYYDKGELISGWSAVYYTQTGLRYAARVDPGDPVADGQRLQLPKQLVAGD